MITRLGAHGGPRPVYGDFSKGAVTRLGMHGGPRPPYASFVGKAASAAGAVMNQLQSSNLGADLYNGTIQ